MSNKTILTISSVLLIFISALLVAGDEDPMMKKSIIYDKKTPDVFYCPIEKHEGIDSMLVKAKPLSKLCEFKGKGVPKGTQSDCFNDADETEFACKEKKRILKKMEAESEEILEKYKPMSREKRAEMYELNHKNE